ncbi:MAG: roadblock/LC7 domain-containing protein [Xanthomonadales bacterium]|nr:roadblock/LC7 domain-containing protein [Xanthomonadales bacterium]
MSATVGRVEHAVLQHTLDDLIARDSGIHAAMFCTSDGFELASNLPPTISSATLSAMVSSQFALGDALCRETGLKSCRDLVIDASSGRVIIMEVRGTNRGFVLAAIASTRYTLGNVLYDCRQVADEIGPRVTQAFQ